MNPSSLKERHDVSGAWARLAAVALSVVVLTFLPCLRAKGDSAFAGEFLTLGVGGRALAMGGGYAALASDATALYWNPAGLGQLTGSDASFMHSTLHGLDAYDYLALARKMESGVWSASWLRVGIDDIIITRVPDAGSPVSSSNRPTAQATAGLTDSAFTMGWGRRLLSTTDGGSGGDLFGGLSGKFLLTSAPRGTNAFGFGADIGLLGTWMMTPSMQLRGAVAVQDFFRTKIYWNTVPREGEPSHRDTILQNFRIGAAVTLAAPRGDSDVTLGVETNSRDHFEMHYGAEWAIGRSLALRMGMTERKSSNDTLRDLTAGAGFRLLFTGEQAFLVDYAFTGGDLGNSHRISLGMQL